MKKRYSYFEDEILKLLRTRDRFKTICPSEVLLPKEKKNKNLMAEVRAAAFRLADTGKITITQKGIPVDYSQIKGPIRLGLSTPQIPIEPTIFLGIDQTGAVDKNGKPKALPACMITGNNIQLFYLREFSKEAILCELKEFENPRILICVDCVIGLPQPLGLSWRQALRKIPANSGYGMLAARKFFKTLSSNKIYYRQVEIELGANSVFREMPYQKNIQTGSFRIWKDIASKTNDFFVPFLKEDSQPGQIPVYEGYPSYSWTALFGVRKRAPKEITKYLKVSFPNLKISRESRTLLKKDQNMADALVLAITMQEHHLQQPPKGQPSTEGWILGYTSVKNS